MKSLIASIAILALVGLVVGVVAQAQEAAVTATVTVQNVTISVDDGVVEYGTLASNTSKDTLTLTDTQTVTNNGNVNVDLDIRGQDSNNWTLAGTTGTDQYIHKFSTNSFSTSSALTTSNQPLTTGIVPTGTQDFDLQITTPNPSTVFDSQSVNITVVATAS